MEPLRPPSRIRLALGLILLAGLARDASALPFRVGYIPNGDKFGCSVCHVDPDGGGELTPFGLAVEELVLPGGEEQFWGPELAGADSDGDGATNGAELGDPQGKWKAGEPDPGAASSIGHPGRRGRGGKVGKPLSIHMDVRARMRYDRDAQGGDWDSTLYTNLLARDVVPGRLDVKVSGWGIWDMDSDDSFDEALDNRTGRLSEAYADVHGLGPIAHARLGRQYLYDVDNLHVDGVRLESRAYQDVKLFVFGGRPISYYDEAGSGAYVGGGGAVWKPSWRTRHQVDSYYLREQHASVTASAWRWNQYWFQQARTQTRLRFLDSEIRDFRVLLTKFFEPWKLGFDLEYYLQPHERGDGEESYTWTLSSFGRLLGARSAHYRLRANINKYWGENWLTQVGGSVQRRRHDSHGERYNGLESNAAHFAVTRLNTFAEGLDATLAGETLDNEQDTLHAITGDVSYRASPEWRFSLGSSLARYNLDPIDFPLDLGGPASGINVRSDVDSLRYFGRARWRPAHRRWNLSALVAFEDADGLGRNALTASLGINYRLQATVAR